MVRLPAGCWLYLRSVLITQRLLEWKVELGVGLLLPRSPPLQQHQQLLLQLVHHYPPPPPSQRSSSLDKAAGRVARCAAVFSAVAVLPREELLPHPREPNFDSALRSRPPYCCLQESRYRQAQGQRTQISPCFSVSEQTPLLLEVPQRQQSHQSPPRQFPAPHWRCHHQSQWERHQCWCWKLHH